MGGKRNIHAPAAGAFDDHIEFAARTGYGSDMELPLAFKRENGMTPGAYRRSRKHMSDQ